MPTYVTLINWTDQGVKNYKDTVDRYEAAQVGGQGNIRTTTLRAFNSSEMRGVIEKAS